MMPNDSPSSTICSPTMTTTKVCRLCGAKDVPFLNIFGTGMDLASKIEELLFIEVKEWDELPHKICFRCSTKVTEFHEFLENCVKTQGQFSKLLGKPYNFKRDKNTNARKNWEAKLNKSKLSNDQYCEELVKKALESVGSLKPLSLKDKEQIKSITSTPVINKIIKRPSRKKDIKIILKRVDGLNFPGIKKTGDGKFLVSGKANQSQPTPSTTDANSSKFSDLLQYKCQQCNEIIQDKTKVNGHVCKTAQSKETPVNTVNPIKRSRSILKKPNQEINNSSNEIINLDDDDYPETTITVKKNNVSDAVSTVSKSTIQGKNSILLNMLVPEPSKDASASNAGNSQMVPMTLPANYCLVPMSDNTFAIQMMPTQSQNNVPMLQNNHNNFQTKLLSGGQFFQNNMNYLPVDQPIPKNLSEIGHVKNSNFQPMSNQSFPPDLRSAVEMSQKYLCSLNPSSDQVVIPETVCVERTKKRKGSSKNNEAKKPNTPAESCGPYPVSLLYRNTQEEHNDAVKSDSYVKNSNAMTSDKKVNNPMYTIMPPKTAEKSSASLASKNNETHNPHPKKRGRKRSDTTIPAQNIKDTPDRTPIPVNADTQATVSEGPFFTVVNVEPFFKPGNVPPMKICLKKSTAQVHSTNVVPVTFEPPRKKDNMASENLSKKNDNTLYSCSICDLEFTREKRLLSHYKTHYEGFNDDEYL